MKNNNNNTNGSKTKMFFFFFFLFRSELKRCEAKNKYFKLPSIVRHTLHIVNGKRTKSTFLPKLQNDVILIPNGNPLRLYCATTTGNSIRWTFTPRNRSINAIPLIVQKPNELKIDSTTVHEHDGIYKCASDTENQVRID